MSISGKENGPLEYLYRKIFKPDPSGNYLANPVIKSFNVPKSFLKQVRVARIRQREANKFPQYKHLPRRVDVDQARDQYELPKKWVQYLREQIIQGTGRIESPGDVGIPPRKP